MSERYDCSDPEQRRAGIAAAAEAARKGQLIVLPTDTVYGIGADAFTPAAIASLLSAKGRGRDMPPPVLVGTVRAGAALVEDMGPFGQDLIDEFWPGALTLVCRANQSLRWDLGETRGTVAVRMPQHDTTLDLLTRTGPLAVSSANTTGAPPATTATEAEEQLGDAIAVYLDAGPCPGGVASTIIDLTGTVPRLLRAGAIRLDRIREVAALTAGDDTDFASGTAEPDAAGAGTDESVGDDGGESPGDGGVAREPDTDEGAPADSGAGDGAAGEASAGDSASAEAGASEGAVGEAGARDGASAEPDSGDGAADEAARPGRGRAAPPVNAPGQ